MEYFGKIECISYDDLIREPDRIMSPANYKQLQARKQINVVRPGKGLGSYALVEVATLPQRFYDRVRAKYGDMNSEILRMWFASHFQIDAKARSFYTKFRFENGSALPPEHINEYTLNASAIQSVLDLLGETVIMRKAMKGGPVNWSELAGAINYYSEEFGHTLPVSPNRFKKKVNEFKAQGYESLISRKFRNQNRRKVTYDIESLIEGLKAMSEHPYDTVVAEMYNQFVTGELEVYDPATGEVFNPEDFRDKDGNPVVLSKSTIANYLNNPMTKALLAKEHMTQWDFNNRYRPHHLRSRCKYSGSKISLDDRDLPRPMPDNTRVKAYYAYDVMSHAVVGYAYSRKKNDELFLNCMRSMFRTLYGNGFNIPGELEVEHHLVRDFSDGLMQAKVIFPLIRWCNPGNCNEKRSEQFHREKKYAVEKRTQSGIGRWWARLEEHRPKVEKVYDELNNTYKVPTYKYDQLVADDIASIREYNTLPHPNQKRFPGMTRWEVFCRCQNPKLEPWDIPVLFRYIGECTKTTIRHNAYLTVQNNKYRLSSPEIISRLEPRNYTVEAYWLPDERGEINEVHIYQNGKLIDSCKKVALYNEATFEQTEADHEAYLDQAKYVAQFDSIMRKDKIHKIATVRKDVASAVKEAEAVAAPVLETEEDDWSEYMDAAERYAASGGQAV